MGRRPSAPQPSLRPGRYRSVWLGVSSSFVGTAAGRRRERPPATGSGRADGSTPNASALLAYPLAIVAFEGSCDGLRHRLAGAFGDEQVLAGGVHLEEDVLALRRHA